MLPSSKELSSQDARRLGPPVLLLVSLVSRAVVRCRCGVCAVWVCVCESVWPVSVVCVAPCVWLCVGACALLNIGCVACLWRERRGESVRCVFLFLFMFS